jgi:hypothetical protein
LSFEQLREAPLQQANACATMRRRARLAKQTLRDTGIADYLKMRGTFENAAAVINCAASMRLATQFHNRMRDEISLGWVGRFHV